MGTSGAGIFGGGVAMKPKENKGVIQIREYLLRPGHNPPSPNPGFVRIVTEWTKDPDTRFIKWRTTDRFVGSNPYG